MMSDQITRRLAAIVAADVAGYSRMMSADEIGTIDAVRRLREETIAPIATSHGGRIVKTMGDGFLLEFSSVVASVQAAIAIQAKLRDINGDNPQAQRVELRIGIHVGDIVFQEDDIFGDGVNVAARVEPLASPGGIGISDEAYRQVRDRLDITWDDGGLQDLKNISHRMRVWHWNRAPEIANTDRRSSVADRASGDTPSVAVLPFDNMSNDPEQDYFADGMTEDLITDLSKISGLFVVARNSTFAFKGQAVDIPTVARRLGVANVIEGSVRKMGGRVRINVQLIDAATGGHLWAERYDGSLDSVFELQDAVSREVVSALSVRLTPSESKRLCHVHTTNLEAYELFVQAKATPYPPIPGRIEAARALFEQVVDMAPEFSGGYAGLSWLISFTALWGHEDPAKLGLRAEALAQKAIAVDVCFGWAYTALALALVAQRRFDEAVDAGQQGLEYLPNDADANAFMAVIHSMRGNHDAAIQAASQAVKLSPNFINGPYLNVMSHCLFMAGRYEDALVWYEKNIARGGPVGPPALCWAAGSYQMTGNAKAAQNAVAELKLRFPKFGLKDWNFLGLIEHDADRARIEALFRDAGIGD